MPTYVYKREDGSTFEVEQRISEDALDVCPTTGQSVSRVITGGTGLIFKGTGFYQTDYVRNSDAKKSTKDDGASGSESTDKSDSEAATASTSDETNTSASAKGSSDD